jgi:hypothetical protein
MTSDNGGHKFKDDSEFETGEIRWLIRQERADIDRE